MWRRNAIWFLHKSVLVGASVWLVACEPSDGLTELQREFRGFPPDLAPLYVLGDINEDGRVDASDRALLLQLLDKESPDIAEASCFAAADVSRDGAVDAMDLTAFDAMIDTDGLAAPALYAEPYLDCSHRSRFVAAPLDWSVGEPLMLRLLQGKTTDQAELTLVDGEGEINASKDRRGWEVVLAPTLDPDSAVVLQFSMGREQFFYTLMNFTRQAQEQATQETWVEAGWSDLDGDGDIDDPSDLPPPTAFGEEIESVATCPQERQGCEALVIDFMKKMFAVDADLTKAALEGIGCNLQYVAPVFVPVPKPIRVLSHSGRVKVYPPSDVAVARAKERNRAMWATIRTAIAAHRTNTAQGRNFVLQLVNGHGFGGGSYGHWDPGFSTGGGVLSRAPFHQGNYIAARGKVCNAMAMDWSCYSGMTPKVIDRLNNTGNAAYTDTPTIDHGFHAALWADMAQSQSSSSESCGEIGAWILDVSVSGLIRTHGKHRDYDRLAHLGFRPFVIDEAAGKYSDRGYNKRPGTSCETASHVSAY